MFTIKHQGKETHVDFTHAQSNSDRKYRNPETGRMKTEHIPQLYYVIYDENESDHGHLKVKKLLPTKGITRCVIYTDRLDTISGEGVTDIIATDVAYCNPTDNWNYNEGRKHALANALKDIDRADRKPFWDAYFATRHGKY